MLKSDFVSLSTPFGILKKFNDGSYQLKNTSDSLHDLFDNEFNTFAFLVDEGFLIKSYKYTQKPKGERETVINHEIFKNSKIESACDFLDLLAMQRFKINKSYTVSLIVDLVRYSKVKLGLLLIPSNEKKQGIHIKSVCEGGLAHKSGIKNDDIILKIDDKEVHFHKELTNVLENNKSMILTIKRKNQLHKIHINLNNN